MFFILLLLVFSSQKRLSLVIDEFVFNASPNATPPLSLISVSGGNEFQRMICTFQHQLSFFVSTLQIQWSECCVGFQCFSECLSKYFSILCFCFEEMNEKQKCLKFCRSSLDSLLLWSWVMYNSVTVVFTFSAWANGTRYSPRIFVPVCFLIERLSKRIELFVCVFKK